MSQLGRIITAIDHRTSRFRQPLRPRSELHDYWRDPQDAGNRPEAYLDGVERSRFLVDLVRPHIESDQAVLEIGCNVGRNLETLRQSGFTDLTGVEISAGALEALRTNHPDLARVATLVHGPAEEIVPSFPDGAFEAVFTMAVLEHMHPDSAELFHHIARVSARLLVTIEDEASTGRRHVRRNYGKVFTGLGFEQVSAQNCDGLPGLNRYFQARVFLKTPPGA